MAPAISSMGEFFNGVGQSLTPFLCKCYDVVSDPFTNKIISWSDAGDSFVVWDQPSFTRNILPKYFKHNNFSSFVRQLNTYGFRKVDPDRWEFANDGFQKGEKHLLKLITRKKPAQSQSVECLNKKDSLTAACIEVGKFGLEAEVERLKRDKNVLMQELVKVRQHQQTTEHQLKLVKQQLQGMERNQQQMMSFFAMVMQKPAFLAQLLQQNGMSGNLVDTNKYKNIPALQNGSEIVKYQPFGILTEKPLLISASTQLSRHEDLTKQQFENVDRCSSKGNLSNLMKSDSSSPGVQHDEMVIFSDGCREYLDRFLSDSVMFDEDMESVYNLDGHVEGAQHEMTSHEWLLAERMKLLASEISKEL